VTPPRQSLRLFAPGAELDSERHQGWLIERLLEDGDSNDLRWLFQAVPLPAIAEWLRRYAGRRLTRRSRALWCTLLKVEPAPESPLSEELWPA